MPGHRFGTACPRCAARIGSKPTLVTATVTAKPAWAWTAVVATVATGITAATLVHVTGHVGWFGKPDRDRPATDHRGLKGTEDDAGEFTRHINNGVMFLDGDRTD